MCVCVTFSFSFLKAPSLDPQNWIWTLFENSWKNEYICFLCPLLSLQMSNLTEPQSLLKEIAKQTSGELTSVEVIVYVEALSRSASALASAEKDYTVKPSAINSTLSVGFVYHGCFSINTWSSAWAVVMFWTGLRKQLLLHKCPTLLSALCAVLH